MEKSINFIKDNIDNNSTVVVAVSSGPDSMCLLSLLLRLRKEKNLKIVVAHINHNLREESKEEYSFVKKYSEDNNCKFEGTTFKEYETNSIELEARNKRYDFFEKILKKYESNYLLTAHHGDDLIETVLMRLTRGSSLDGYVGFKKKSIRDNYVLLRPLIYYTKEEILNYITINNIPYRIDKSNFSEEYTRNRYRLNILPLLKKENSEVNKKYLKFSEEIEECSNFINNYIDEKYNMIVKEEMIDLNQLKLEDKFIIKKIIFKYLSNIYNDKIYLIESKHIYSIIDMVFDNKSNIEISLPNSIELQKSYDVLMKKEFINKSNYKKEITNETIFPQGKISILSDTELTNNYVCHLNSEEIELPLFVRNRKNGDFIEVLNLNGKKKVKDIFIDEKVDISIRDEYPIVVDNNDNILWIPGLKKSKYDSLKTGKYDIILWYDKGGK